jgi:hypothetical protein
MTFKALKLAFASLAVLAVCVAPTRAGTVNLDIAYAGSFDAGFNPIGNPLDTGTHVAGAYHQFDVLMTLGGLAAGEDLQVLIFDLNLGAGFTPSDVPWTGATLQWDPPGPPGLTNIFSESSDTGNDLKAITIIAANANTYGGVHTQRPGVAGGPLGAPTNIGSVFVFWDGTTPSSAVVAANPNISDPFATVIGGTSTVFGPSAMGFGPAYIIEGEQGIPPSANDLSLLDLDTTVTPTAVGTVTASGDPLITFGDLTFVSYTATNGGVDDGNAGVGALLGADGSFSFPIQGRARGEYRFTYSATNPFGSDSANILVEIQNVPEPASIALFGIAMVGGLGLVRRRNG